jgi:hypothetical protein
MLIDTLLDEHIPPTKGFFLHIAHLGDASLVDGFKVRSWMLWQVDGSLVTSFTLPLPKPKP